VQQHDGVALSHLHVRHLQALDPPPLLLVRKCRRDHVGFSFFLCRSRRASTSTCVPTTSVWPERLPRGLHRATRCFQLSARGSAVCRRARVFAHVRPRREAASQGGNRPRFVTPCLICVTAWGSVPSTPTPIALTRRSLTRCGVHLKSHLVSRWHARYNPPDGVCSSHGMREPAVPWAEVPGHARSMRSREASTGRDRAVEEPFLTPQPSSCPSPFLILV